MVLLLPPSRRGNVGHGSFPLLGLDELLFLLPVLRAIRIIDLKREVTIRRLAAERTQDFLAAECAHLGDLVSFREVRFVESIVLHGGVGGVMILMMTVVIVVHVRGVTNRRVLGHVLDVAGSLGDLLLEGVAVDAGGGGRLAVLAGTAGEHEHVAGGVLFGVEHVGAGRKCFS